MTAKMETLLVAVVVTASILSGWAFHFVVGDQSVRPGLEAVLRKVPTPAGIMKTSENAQEASMGLGPKISNTLVSTYEWSGGGEENCTALARRWVKVLARDGYAATAFATGETFEITSSVSDHDVTITLSGEDGGVCRAMTVAVSG